MIEVYKVYRNVQINHLIFFWLVNIKVECLNIWSMSAMWSHQDGYFIFSIDIPQNGSVSEPLTHTSRHRLVKSTPGAS